jgi:arabinogalactan oligomer / maltooligosaccharide transport system substrate-binding protein/arabinogalactan oligomer / maltooligosaccharide transport system permease protein
MTSTPVELNQRASPSRRVSPVPLTHLLIAFFFVASVGCGSKDTRRVVTIWHPMRSAERKLLVEEFARFEKTHPDIRLRALFKDVEELRSAYQAAALAGGGPDLIYGPSDVVDTFHTMGLLQDMAPWLPEAERKDFIDGALTYLPTAGDPTKRDLVQVGDHLGNHLALVYNRKFVPVPPKTTDEMVATAVANTIDQDGDGRKERYGLVWNFSEPYLAIPFLTGYGAWLFAEPSSGAGSGDPVPSLDTPQSVAAYRFIQQLRDKYQVAPANCDYELADSLFKAGRAAMIINGDWSWADYLSNPNIDAAVAVLPVVSATGLPMRPMVASKGFSLNANASPEAAEAAMAFVRHMTSPAVQQRLVDKFRMVPTRRSTYAASLSSTDPTYRASLAQMENGRLMPVDTELRAVWDAMKPPYQALLGGTMTPAAAAAAMQADALRRIELMHRRAEPGASVRVLQVAGMLLLVGWLVWQRKSFVRFVHDWRSNRLAYLFALPAVLTVLAVIVFPFFYNILLSLSNMSLVHFKDWQVVGVQNYVEVFTDPNLWRVFVKTIVWTVGSVTFHVVLGVMLAVALNGPVWGKTGYRLLLITPWAVPAFITALTWRGMFDYEYGAVNHILVAIQQFPPVAWLLILLNLQAPVNWLGNPTHAFEACIVTNIWLGFPFMMVIALGGMQGIPQELYEAARIDRASRWHQFWHITLPLLKPVLVPAITLGTIWTFNNLNVIWLVSNGGEPQDSTHILVSYVYNAVFNLYRYGYGAALSMVIFLVLLVFSLVFLGRSRATESVYE